MTTRRDEHIGPSTGEDSERVLDEAISSLATLRSFLSAMPASTSTSSPA